MEEYGHDAFLLESQLKDFSANSLVSFCVVLKNGSPQAHDLRMASSDTRKTQPSDDIQKCEKNEETQKMMPWMDTFFNTNINSTSLANNKFNFLQIHFSFPKYK